MLAQRCVVTVVILLSGLLAALAQPSTSQITGTVTDSTGAVIAGATVAVTSEATGAVNKQTTTSAGVYAFSAMPVGIYQLTVEAAGFKGEKRTGVALTVQTVTTVNFQMELGQASEVISVESAAPPIESSNAALGGCGFSSRRESACHLGSGIRYRLRWIVVFTYAKMAGSGPGDIAQPSITVAPAKAWTS